jgi:hypothetical protein
MNIFGPNFKSNISNFFDSLVYILGRMEYFTSIFWVHLVYQHTLQIVNKIIYDGNLLCKFIFLNVKFTNEERN